MPVGLVVALAVATVGHAARLSAQAPARDVRVILLTPVTDRTAQTEADRTFAALAESVTDTLLVAAYGLDRGPVVEALLTTQARLGTPGAVRVIEHPMATNERFVGGGVPVDPLETAGISITQATSRALMHDKFAVFGGSVVWTGSANFTKTGFAAQYENVVVITSTALAEAYRAEFALMHGKGQFGRGKALRTPVSTTTDAGRVTVAFGPKGGMEELILTWIDAAETSIDVAAYEFTRVELAQALASAAARGVRVRVLYDDGHLSGPSLRAKARLCQAGIAVFEEKTPHTLHHKFAVFDAPTGGVEPVGRVRERRPAGDSTRRRSGGPGVITGSANWTGNGMTDNDENILAIESAEVAGTFAGGFEELWRGDVETLCFAAVIFPLVANRFVVGEVHGP